MVVWSSVMWGCTHLIYLFHVATFIPLLHCKIIWSHWTANNAWIVYFNKEQLQGKANGKLWEHFYLFCKSKWFLTNSEFVTEDAESGGTLKWPQKHLDTFSSESCPELHFSKANLKCQSRLQELAFPGNTNVHILTHVNQCFIIHSLIDATIQCGKSLIFLFQYINNFMK